MKKRWKQEFRFFAPPVVAPSPATGLSVTNQKKQPRQRPPPKRAHQGALPLGAPAGPYPPKRPPGRARRDAPTGARRPRRARKERARAEAPALGRAPAGARPRRPPCDPPHKGRGGRRAKKLAKILAPLGAPGSEPDGSRGLTIFCDWGSPLLVL